MGAQCGHSNSSAGPVLGFLHRPSALAVRYPTEGRGGAGRAPWHLPGRAQVAQSCCPVVSQMLLSPGQASWPCPETTGLHQCLGHSSPPVAHLTLKKAVPQPDPLLHAQNKLSFQASTPGHLLFGPRKSWAWNHGAGTSALQIEPIITRPLPSPASWDSPVRSYTPSHRLGFQNRSMLTKLPGQF